MTIDKIPSAAEELHLPGLIQMESVSLQKTQAMLPMISDPELRQQAEGCIQTGRPT